VLILVFKLLPCCSNDKCLHHLLKMEPTQSSETSTFNTQTPGKYPEDNLSAVLITSIIKRPNVKCNVANNLVGTLQEVGMAGYHNEFFSRDFSILKYKG
jgi:hypothetical protein